MTSILSILFLSIVGAVLLLSVAVLIAYLFTGQQIGEIKEQHVLDFILLVVGLAVQYVFKEDCLVSNVVQQTLTLTFFAVAVSESKRCCCDITLEKPSNEIGLKAGLKGLWSMVVNALKVVLPCFGLSLAFQVNIIGLPL